MPLLWRLHRCSNISRKRKMFEIMSNALVCKCARHCKPVRTIGKLTVRLALKSAFWGRKEISDNVTSRREANARGWSTSLSLNYTYPAATAAFSFRRRNWQIPAVGWIVDRVPGSFLLFRNRNDEGIILLIPLPEESAIATKYIVHQFPLGIFWMVDTAVSSLKENTIKRGLVAS